MTMLTHAWSSHFKLACYGLVDACICMADVGVSLTTDRVVRALLQGGADPGARNASNKTAAQVTLVLMSVDSIRESHRC